MYYKTNLDKWFKLKRKKSTEFGLEKRAMLHLERHGAPFFPFCNYLFKRISLWTMFHGINHGLIYFSSSSTFSLDSILVPNNYHFL